MTTLRRITLATLAAPLVLGLAACNSGEGDGTVVNGDPLPTVEAPAGTTWDQTVTRTEDGGWLVGNPDAPLKLLEYGSTTCPACAAFSMDGSRSLHANYINKGMVSYEFRSVLIHGVVDLLITRILECAPVEAAVPLADQVWGDLDAVTGPFSANQAALEAAFQLPEDQRFAAMAQASQLDQFFAARGISTEQTQACLSDPAAITALAEITQAKATEDEVTGTPTFFLNGRRIDGTAWSVVEGELQRAGARPQ